MEDASTRMYTLQGRGGFRIIIEQPSLGFAIATIVRLFVLKVGARSFVMDQVGRVRGMGRTGERNMQGDVYWKLSMFN